LARVSVKALTSLALGSQMALLAHGAFSGREVGLSTQASYEESEDLDSESAGSWSGSDESAASENPRATGKNPLALCATRVSQLPRLHCSAVGVRLLFAVVAVVCLTAYAGYHVLRSPPPGADEHRFRPPTSGHSVLTPTGLTARQLLESPQLTAIASAQIMSTGNAALNDDDRQMVNSVTSAGFGNLSLMLDRRAPEIARRLSAIRMSEEQTSSVLGVVRHMSDARVQNLAVSSPMPFVSFCTPRRLGIAATWKYMLGKRSSPAWKRSDDCGMRSYLRLCDVKRQVESNVGASVLTRTRCVWLSPSTTSGN